MGFVERMKWWHWTALSLVLGATLAFLNSGGADTAVSHGSVAPVVFETGLITPPWVDPKDPNHRVAYVSDIVVHPLEGLRSNGFLIKRQLVTYTAFRPPTTGSSGEMSTEYYWAAYPYEPIPRSGNDRRHTSYPAASPYVGDKGDTVHSLAQRFYKKDTPQGVTAIINANPPLRDAKGPDDAQIKAGRGYWIPWDPAAGHTVSDFLVAVDSYNKQQLGAAAIPVRFHYYWWESSNYGYEFWMIGTFVLVGVIWPSLLHVMIRGGLGSMTTEEYDLSRFKGGTDPAMMPKPSAAAVTQSDMDRLRELEATMAANLKTGPTAAPAVAEAPQQAQAATAVAKLPGAAAEAPKAPPPKPEEPKEYGGEFYPVAKPHGKPEEKKK